jgi:general stress protein CsbA
MDCLRAEQLMLDTAWQTLQDTRIATAIREGESLFPWIECVHVLALTLVIGSIAIVDLRLLGWASRQRGVTQVSADVLPLTWTAFVFAALTGALLFASNATEYAHNLYFQLKMGLIGLAGINMAAYHLFLARDCAAWQNAEHTPRRARLAGALSLALWIAIAACGRWIGFTINAPG